MSDEAGAFNLFADEEALLERAGAVLARLTLASGDELVTLHELHSGYARLLRESKQLIRIADRRERELNRANRRLQQLSQTLAYQADHDPLTGALNKGAIRRLAEDMLASGEGALLLLDLDHFKQVNDTLGHPCGDRLLQALVELVQELLPEEGVLGRFGGEEFLILLRDGSLLAARALAERLRQQVEANEIDWQGRPVRATVSIGLTLCQASEDFATVYQRVDQALYAAKHGGRNRVVIG